MQLNIMHKRESERERETDIDKTEKTEEIDIKMDKKRRLRGRV